METTEKKARIKLKKIIIKVSDVSQCVVKPPHIKVKVEMYCETCKRIHRFHYNEWKNGRAGAKTVQDIIDKYAWKYCNREDYMANNGFAIMQADAKGVNLVETFISFVKSLPNAKIITLNSGDRLFVVDVSSDGKFGCQPPTYK